MCVLAVSTRSDLFLLPDHGTYREAQECRKERRTNKFCLGNLPVKVMLKKGFALKNAERKKDAHGIEHISVSLFFGGKEKPCKSGSAKARTDARSLHKALLQKKHVRVDSVFRVIGVLSLFKRAQEVFVLKHQEEKEDVHGRKRKARHKWQCTCRERETNSFHTAVERKGARQRRFSDRIP